MDSSPEKTQDQSSSDEMPSPFPLKEIPATVVDAGEETIPYAVSVTVTMNSSPKPLEVLPLRMVPFGGTEPITFSQEELDRLSKREQVHPRKQEVPIPLWLKSHSLYVEGDWKAFVQTRNAGRKDRTYAHREYVKEFRSSVDVNIFLKSNGPTTGIFDGRKLQKKKKVGPDGEGAGTSKPMGGR